LKSHSTEKVKNSTESMRERGGELKSPRRKIAVGLEEPSYMPESAFVAKKKKSHQESENRSAGRLHVYRELPVVLAGGLPNPSETTNERRQHTPLNSPVKKNKKKRRKRQGGRHLDRDEGQKSLGKGGHMRRVKSKEGQLAWRR